MRITKFGHCCLLIEEAGARFLTDPGSFNETPDVRDLDAILLTHEHQDHVHLPALKNILEKNPSVQIITHQSVGKLLDGEKISYSITTDGATHDVAGVVVSSFGSVHACIHHDLLPIENTGFFIANRLWYPGDSFYVPNVGVDVLALPIAGPWLRLEEAIEYAKQIKPRIVFPVHDGMLRSELFPGTTRRVATPILEKAGIDFIDMIAGSTHEF